jgi:hypothetical protein
MSRKVSPDHPHNDTDFPCPENTRNNPQCTQPTNQFQIMYKTEYACCSECGSTLVETYDNHWLVCPRCSRISRDKPPDFHTLGEWEFHAADGVEMESLGNSLLYEHALEP